MSNNITIPDKNNVAVVAKSTDTSGVHTVHHNIDKGGKPWLMQVVSSDVTGASTIQTNRAITYRINQ